VGPVCLFVCVCVHACACMERSEFMFMLLNDKKEVTEN
jgi:hypothetical protein